MYKTDRALDSVQHCYKTGVKTKYKAKKSVQNWKTILRNIFPKLYYSGSHVLVSFLKDEHQPIAILPVTCVRDCEISDLKGIECGIEWTKRSTLPKVWLQVCEYSTSIVSFELLFFQEQ